MIERIWRNRGILFPIVAILMIVDIGITLYFWDIEGNPIVISMGQLWFTIVKVITLGIIGYLWAKIRSTDSLVELMGRTFLGGLGVFYAGVLMINLSSIMR